jgi:DNA-binding PadR family transcriptional regulator
LSVARCGGGIATQNYTVTETSREAVSEKIEERLVRNCLDLIILKALKKKERSGYEIISFIHRQFGILLSAGTIYSILYSLERNNLVRAISNQKARCYSLTEKGEETLNIIMGIQGRLKALVEHIF